MYIERHLMLHILESGSNIDECCIFFCVCVHLPGGLRHCRSRTASEINLSSPYFPLSMLKKEMMSLLTEAVHKGAAHIRDPIGGSNAAHFG